MICNSFRASAKAGCRRASSSSYLGGSSAGRRRQQQQTADNRQISLTLFSSTAAPQECRRTHASSSNIIATGRPLLTSLSKDPDPAGLDGGRHRAGVGSSNYSADRADEKDSPTTTATTSTTSRTQQTMADRWRAARSKVSAEYLKRFLKKYGRVAVTFHVSVFLATLGTCYSVVDYGGLDIPALVKNVPLLADNLPPASAGNLAIAYGMTSAVGPPRAVLTVTLTPRIAKFWSGREANRRRKQGETPDL